VPHSLNIRQHRSTQNAKKPIATRVQSAIADAVTNIGNVTIPSKRLNQIRSAPQTLLVTPQELLADTVSSSPLLQTHPQLLLKINSALTHAIKNTEYRADNQIPASDTANTTHFLLDLKHQHDLQQSITGLQLMLKIRTAKLSLCIHIPQYHFVRNFHVECY